MLVLRASSTATIFLLISASALPSSSIAGGLIGDIINRVAPGVGTQLDDAHRQIKEAIPPYKAVEEAGSKVVNEAHVQAGAPVLQEMIARSRDDALQRGVQAIPADIRRNLEGFVDARILNVVRYRVQGGGDLSLQRNAIRYGEASAITLDYVVVFKENNDALYNPTLWVHELRHVRQFQDWGIRDFSIRYLRDYGAVEREAYEEETRYLAWATRKNVRQYGSNDMSSRANAANRPVHDLGRSRNSNLCSSVVGTCSLNGSAPVGTPCWCNTAYGPATGALIPTTAGSSAPINTPAQPQANACTTNQGSCALGVNLPVGAPCVCYTRMGNMPGVAQQLAPAQVCTTQFGSCQLGVALFGGDPCYCPSYSGPVWGRAQ
jgi:hypothetical protein